MGRIVTFDMDSLLAKVKIFAEEAPSLLAIAETAGWAGASKLSAFVPMAAPLANTLSRLTAGTDGLTAPGMPDVGPRGKGRLSYLRNARHYSDSAVVKACESIAMGGFANSKLIADTVNYTLICMYQDVKPGEWTDEQTRRAVDQILENDGLSEGTCEKLGDMIWFALNAPPKAG